MVVVLVYLDAKYQIEKRGFNSYRNSKTTVAGKNIKTAMLHCSHIAAPAKQIILK